MKRVELLICVVAAMVAGGCSNIERSRSLANPATPPQTIAQQVCSICHGMDGNAANPNFPNLAEQQSVYLIAQLKGFRSHNRLDPAGFEYMWGLSRSLTDDQIKGLADYYAAQRLRLPPFLTASDALLVSEGRAIFEGGVASMNIPACATCHGAQGQGNEIFPRLAYQHADYLRKQLIVFQRTDDRPEGSVMKTVAHDLTPRNIQAVAVYLERFPAKP
jgi:cytochrome c553